MTAECTVSVKSIEEFVLNHHNDYEKCEVGTGYVAREGCVDYDCSVVRENRDDPNGRDEFLLMTVRTKGTDMWFLPN